MIELTLNEAQSVLLSRDKDENSFLRWKFYVNHFLKQEKESEPMSGMWKMSHMFLTRLGVDHDNCAYCGTDGPHEPADKIKDLC